MLALFERDPAEGDVDARSAAALDPEPGNVAGFTHRNPGFIEETG
jgi:hypothetical protein